MALEIGMRTGNKPLMLRLSDFVNDSCYRDKSGQLAEGFQWCVVENHNGANTY